MDGRTLLISFGLWLMLQYVQAIEMPACSQGKYLWRRSNPRHFYLCTSPTEALPMRCTEGYYMCLQEGVEFEACMCHEDGGNSTAANATGEARYEQVQDTGCVFDAPLQDHHRPFGVGYQTSRSVDECKHECLRRNETGRDLPSPAEEEQCVGIDWDTRTNDIMCWLLPRRSHTYNLMPLADVIHYELQCVEPDTTEGEGEGEEEGEGTGTGGGGGGGSVNVIDPKQSTGSTIPDTGSPYALERVEDTSHPGGLDITSMLDSTDYESCKRWCLYRCYCKAVDWDTQTNLCFYHDQLDPGNYITGGAATGVTHVRKTTCTPPLNCWNHAARAVTDTDGEAVISPTHEQVVCQGVCTVIQDTSTTPQTITRGCDENPNPDTPINCYGISTTLFKCTCDTHRCNGLNIQIQANQKAHLPFDGDFVDHALSYKRDVVPIEGYTAPTFSCTNAISNCSAYFTGTNGIAIHELGQILYGETVAANTISPAFTITAAVYPIDFDGSGSDAVQGIAGNARTSDDLPSFQLIKDGFKWGAGVLAENTASLTTVEALQAQLDDYDPLIEGSLQQWRLLTLVYDGVENDATREQASLNFFVNDAMMSGNSRRDNGHLQLRSEPVTIGVVAGQPFTGYIDEFRVWGTTLDSADIQALLNAYNTKNIVV